MSVWLSPDHLNQDWIRDRLTFFFSPWTCLSGYLQTTSIRIESEIVSPSSSVHDLGVYINADLSKRTQVRQIRRSLPSTALQLLVVSLVLSRLDYGNATLSGIPAYLLSSLQSVTNAMARLVTDQPRSVHICLQSRWITFAPGGKANSSIWRPWRYLHGTAPHNLSTSVQGRWRPSRRRTTSFYCIVLY